MSPNAPNERLPEGWVKGRSSTRNCTYYINQYSGATQWERPSEAAEVLPHQKVGRRGKGEGMDYKTVNQLSFQPPPSGFRGATSLKPQGQWEKEAGEDLRETTYAATHTSLSKDSPRVANHSRRLKAQALNGTMSEAMSDSPRQLATETSYTAFMPPHEAHSPNHRYPASKGQRMEGTGEFNASTTSRDFLRTWEQPKPHIHYKKAPQIPDAIDFFEMDSTTPRTPCGKPKRNGAAFCPSQQFGPSAPLPGEGGAGSPLAGSKGQMQGTADVLVVHQEEGKVSTPPQRKGFTASDWAKSSNLRMGDTISPLKQRKR